MKEIIIAILIVVVFAAVIAILAARGKKEIIYKMIFALVDEAEEIYGSKTGKRKFAYVVERVYAILPAFFRLFITYDMLEKWIEKALVEAKEYWAERAGITEETQTPKVSGFAQE